MTKARIWLINPPVYADEMFSRGSRSSATLSPPLGIAYIAAYLRKHGYFCEILDGAVAPIPFEEILRRAGEFDFIGITSVTAYYSRVRELIETLKTLGEKCPKILVGGPHATAMPEEVLDDGGDVAIIGEGEETTLELVDFLQRNPLNWRTHATQIRGIVFKDENANIVKTQRRPLIEDLDRIPMPARDLLPMNLYSASVARSSAFPSHTLLTSRGCPGSCTFCSHLSFGKNVRRFSPDRVVEEMVVLRNQYGANDIQIWDDHFVTDHDFINEVKKLLAKEKFDKSFSVESRVDAVTPELLRTLKTMGCEYVAYGIESGSQRILDYIRKNETLEQIRRAVAWTKDAGLKIRGYFILGFPTETLEEMEATLRFAMELDIDVASFTLFVPFPGTADWQRAQKRGTFDSSYYQKKILPEINFLDSPIYVPEGMTAQELLQFHRRAYNRYYLRPKFVAKRLMKLNSFSELLSLTKGAKTLLTNLICRK